VLLLPWTVGGESWSERWRRSVQRRTKTSKNLKKVFLTSWSHPLKKVIAPLLLAEGLLVVSLNTLHLHFVHLCNEYGESHYSLNGWWHGHKLVIWTKLMTCISMCRWGPNKCYWGSQLVLLGVPIDTSRASNILVLLYFLLFSSSLLAKKWYMSLFLYKEL
jgi:hypothetical protein